MFSGQKLPTKAWPRGFMIPQYCYQNLWSKSRCISQIVMCDWCGMTRANGWLVARQICSGQLLVYTFKTTFSLEKLWTTTKAARVNHALFWLRTSKPKQPANSEYSSLPSLYWIRPTQISMVSRSTTMKKWWRPNHSLPLRSMFPILTIFFKRWRVSRIAKVTNNSKSGKNSLLKKLWLWIASLAVPMKREQIWSLLERWCARWSDHRSACTLPINCTKEALTWMDS